MEPLKLGVPGWVLAGLLTTAAPLVAEERLFRFAPQPAGRVTGLEGVYLRDVPPPATGVAETDAELWFFTKDGRFSRSPRGGFSMQALATAAQARGTEGMYWIEKDRIVLAMSGGMAVVDLAFAGPSVTHVPGPIGSTPSAPRITLERKESPGPVIGGMPLVPAREIKAGTRFDALYVRETDPRDGRWVFQADGQFRREAPTPSGYAVAAQGTYRFEEYTLRLEFASGEKQALTVAAAGAVDAAGRPAILWCEGVRLVKL